MYKKNRGFSLLELLVVIAIIAILAVIVAPQFIGSIEKSRASRELAELNSVGKAVSMYYMDNSEYPVMQPDQPIYGRLDNIDFSKIYPKYLSKLPHFSYWMVDYQGNIYHEEYKPGELEGTTLKLNSNYTYKIYDLAGNEVTNYNSNSVNLTQYSKVIPISSRGQQLPDITADFKGLVEHPEAVSKGQTPSDNNEDPKEPPINHKPIPVIKMSPDQGITTDTNITWDYTFTDEDGDKIEKEEWQGNLPKYTTEGEYTVTLKVMDSKGLWSDPAEIKFYVIKAQKIKQIAAGYYHTVALMNDGTLMAWGDNGYGQLGNSRVTSSSAPMPISGLTNIQQISAGAYHTVALMNDGTVKTWGYNNAGQLGDNTTNNRNSPVTVSGLSDVKQITAGYNQTMAIMNDGTVKAWGYNNYGQLGDGTKVAKTIPTTTNGLTNVKQVETTLQHSIFLMNDGTVKVSGTSYAGSMGMGRDFSYSYTPVSVPGLSGVKQIAINYFNSVYLLDNGTVKASGYNVFGQMGNGTTDDNMSPGLVKNLTNVVQVSAGYYHIMALLDDGTVKAWGYNIQGQLGDGTNVTKLLPVTVSGLSNIKQVSAGLLYSMALTNDDTIKSCGDNTYGQLGEGTKTNRNKMGDVNGLN